VSWWGWVLLWTAILAGTGWLFFVLGRRLWRQASALFGDLGTASERLGAVMEQVDALGEQAAARKDLAVFADPVALRREREAAARSKARAKEKRRRDLLAARQRD
jgi:hypothetical protein